MNPDDALKPRETEIVQLMAEELTNREIADRLFIGVETVRWYAKQIYSKLGVSGREEAAQRAAELGLLDAAQPVETIAVEHNLPVPTTTLIGRQQQLADLRHLVGEFRLVTLTGAGGSGKTRLAVELAWQLHANFGDGAAFVDLAPSSSAAQVPAAIAQGIEVVENPGEDLVDTLKRALRQRDQLLVIDNFEHVIAAASVVAELLVDSPQLKILVTSREALRLTAEQEYPVPPLGLPVDYGPIEELKGIEAVAFFVQRARMARAEFTLNNDNANTVAQICSRLDGLPLALELAAARCKLLSPQALLDRLEDRLGTLVSGARDLPTRQQTLRSTLDWSYHLLDEEEKLLFARLAVFRGGRSLDAIDAVCGTGLSVDVLETLAGLVDKSLVYQKEASGGELRFWMLETIHEYAWECLENSGETNVLRRRHAEYFAGLAEHAAPELRLARQAHWYQLLEMEHPNFRNALHWSLDSGEVILGARLVVALWLFWYIYGFHLEGYSWIEQFLPHLDELSAEQQVQYLCGAGSLARLHSIEKSNELLSKSLVLSRQLGDRLHMAWALVFMIETEAGAFAAKEKALSLFRELDYKPGIAQALNGIGEQARVAGDDERAKPAYQECIALCEQTGDTRLQYTAMHNLAFVLQHEGEHQRAINLLRQSLILCHDMKVKSDIAMVIQVLAGSVGASGQPEHAARLLGAAEAALERQGAVRDPVDLPEVEHNIAIVRGQLDEDAFLSCWDMGRQMTLDAAVADALDITNPAS